MFPNVSIPSSRFASRLASRAFSSSALVGARGGWYCCCCCWGGAECEGGGGVGAGAFAYVPGRLKLFESWDDCEGCGLTLCGPVGSAKGLFDLRRSRMSMSVTMWRDVQGEARTRSRSVAP